MILRGATSLRGAIKTTGTLIVKMCPSKNMME
jgi:hypothetical protein